jgi:hypothetical protein
MDLPLLSRGSNHNPSRCCGVLAPCDTASKGRVVIGTWMRVTSAKNLCVQSKPWSIFRLSAQCHIDDAVYEFSDSLPRLIKHAARRIEEGRTDDALRQSFRYGPALSRSSKMRSRRGKDD